MPELDDLDLDLDLDLDAALTQTYARRDELVAARDARRRRIGAVTLVVALVAGAAVLLPVLAGGDEPTGPASDEVAGDPSRPPPPDPAASSDPDVELGPATVSVRTAAVLNAVPAGDRGVVLTFECAGIADEVVSIRHEWSEPASASGGVLWVDAEVAGESAGDCRPGDPGAETTLELDRPFGAGTSVESRPLG